MLRSALFGVLLVPMCLLPGLSRQASAQNPFTFELIEQQASVSMLGALSWFDVDADGDLDVIQVGNNANLSLPANIATVSIATTFGARETEGGASIPTLQYASMDLGISPAWLGDAVWTDVDLDGDHDLVVTGTSDLSAPYAPTTQVALRDGTTFTATTLGLNSTIAGSIDAADVDGDGDEDLLLTGISDAGIPTTLLYVNSGNGTYQEVSSPIPGYAYGNGEFGDMDNDGDHDILVTGVLEDGTFDVSVYANDGAGSFSLYESNFEGLIYGAAHWGDYDSDGDLDILLSGGRISPNIMDGVLHVYVNNTGAFAPIVTNEVGAVLGDAVWGDFDVDGDLDIVAAGGRAIVGSRSVGRLYRNVGSGIVHVANFASPFPTSIQIGDLDGDEDIDLSAAGLNDRQRPVLLQYENGVRLVNNPPTIPEGATSSVDGGNVTFSWSAADDIETPLTGLTYSLRVGTAPGLSDVMISASVSDDGYRLFNSAGNVSHNRSWTLNLPNGTYYWSVQAVDNGFVGSPFSPEQSFTVSESGKGVATGNEDGPDGTAVTTLHNAYPNPFTRSTTVAYDLRAGGFVTIQVYNVLGQRIRTLVDGMSAPGKTEVVWDGTTDGGSRVGGGVYFVRLESADVSMTSTVVVN